MSVPHNSLFRCSPNHFCRFAAFTPRLSLWLWPDELWGKNEVYPTVRSILTVQHIEFVFEWDEAKSDVARGTAVLVTTASVGWKRVKLFSCAVHLLNHGAHSSTQVK